MRTIFLQREVGRCETSEEYAEPAPEHCGDEPHGNARYSGNECSTMC